MKNIMFCVDNIIKTINIGYKSVISRQHDKVKNSVVLYSNIDKNNSTGKRRK